LPKARDGTSCLPLRAAKAWSSINTFSLLGADNNMLQYKALTFNPLAENTYVLWDETKEAVIIDPGNFSPAEDWLLKDFIGAQGLKPVMQLLTHGHIDHVAGCYYVSQAWSVPLLMHSADLDTLRAVRNYAPMYGFMHYTEHLPQRYLSPGQAVSFGQTSLEVLFCPGHSLGHVAFYEAGAQQLFGGDVLFRESIGRTDLPGGDMQTLLHSIRTQLFALPGAVVVHPGHGPSTTIAYEQKHNPFLQ
jgi:hydroxyacylglutathione hydrolase